MVVDVVMFLQHGQGEFSVEVEGENHCGPNHDSPKQFTFLVDIQYPLDALDERGFLLDNQSFRAYFAGLGRIAHSCENLAKRAACDLWRMSGGRCHVVKVAIWAIKGEAMIEFTLDCDPAELTPRSMAGGAS